jgi:hypothetical protein
MMSTIITIRDWLDTAIERGSLSILRGGISLQPQPIPLSSFSRLSAKSTLSPKPSRFFK